MTLEFPLVDISDAPKGAAPAGDKVEARIPISGREGASSYAYHVTLGKDGVLNKHTQSNADELVLLLEGEGTLGIDGACDAVRAGHCWRVPRNTESFFVNAGDADAVLVGFCLGASDAETGGYQDLGKPQPEDMKDKDRPGREHLVHLDDVEPESMSEKDGWLISDFRLPMAKHSGSDSTLFRARFFPGAIHKKHRHENCEEIYFVISGEGAAGAGDDRVKVHGGQFHYIPADTEHWLHNLSESDPIEVVGVYIGAGGVKETGYVYMGEITEDDLAQVK